jgi:hypothetical protein
MSPFQIAHLSQWDKFLDCGMMDKAQKPSNSVIHHHQKPLQSTMIPVYSYIRRSWQSDIGLMFFKHLHKPLPVFLALSLLQSVHLTVPLPLQQILVLKLMCCQLINILLSTVHVYTFNSLSYLLSLPAIGQEQEKKLHVLHHF